MNIFIHESINPILLPAEAFLAGHNKPSLPEAENGRVEFGVRACEFAGRSGSGAISCSVAMREPTIHPTGRNQPHFLPDEALFADRAPPFPGTDPFARRFCFKRRHGSSYYRTCTVVEIRLTLRRSGNVNLMGGLGGTAARRPGLHGRACNTPLLSNMWTTLLAAPQPLLRKQTRGQHVQTTPRRISIKHAV